MDSSSGIVFAVNEGSHYVQPPQDAAMLKFPATIRAWT